MKRTLIARFHSLGDVVLATGIFHRLRENGESVEAATADRFAPIFEGLVAERIWTAGDVESAGRFDSVIDLQANATSKRLLKGLGETRRNRSRSFARRMIVLWGRRRGCPTVPHAVQRYAEPAGCDSADPRDLRPRIVVTDRDLEEARQMRLSWEKTESPCVGLAEGGSRKMKRWPANRFAILSDRLAENGLESLRLLEPVDGPEEGPGIVRAPLRPLKGLLSRCKLLVTNDSGVMHLAVGLGLPVVAIFGSTTLEFGFGPLGEDDTIVERDLACRPCAVHGARFCWQAHRRCLTDVKPNDVLSAALNVLRVMRDSE